MNKCPKCGAEMERGFTTAIGLIGGDKTERERAQLVFVVPGTRTAQNPIAAFNQGLLDAPSTRSFRIEGSRCAACGFLELYASAK